jgi:Holliday junction resolvasome RuvABC endonuclease subunit
LKIAGIDNSMSSPAITIFDLDDKTLEIKNYDYISLYKVKKQLVQDHIFTIPEYDNECQRIVEKNNFLVDILVKREVEYAAIEDYAFSSTGMSYSIGENTGYLKCELFKNKIKLRKYEPTSVKMFFTSLGNADKDLMMKTYIHDYSNCLNLPDKIINEKKPLEDIADSFAICMLLLLELKLRRGLISLKDLPESKIRVFNKIRKDTKTNILDTDFIGD